MISLVKLMDSIKVEEKKLNDARIAVYGLKEREFETEELLKIYGEYCQQLVIVIALKSVYNCMMEEIDD